MMGIRGDEGIAPLIATHPQYFTSAVIRSGEIAVTYCRHRERSEAIQKRDARGTGLLRRLAPRNDGLSGDDSTCSNPAVGR
jgi:hypothetical protein